MKRTPTGVFTATKRRKSKYRSGYYEEQTLPCDISGVRLAAEDASRPSLRD
ncbi:MAG: hypothetical protein ACTSPE_07065 [Candidatus Thorarchaeota archaeon]